MFFRKIVTKSGDKEYAYLKLIENYRDGNRVRQRVIANLGSLENISPQKASRLISGLARICGLDSATELDPSSFGVTRVLESADVLAIRKIWNELNAGRILEEEINANGEKNNLVPLIERMVLKRVIGDDFCEQLDASNIPVAMELMCNAQFKLERKIFTSLKEYLRSPDLIVCHLLACRFQVAKRDQWRGELFENLPYIKKLYLLVAATTEGIPLGFKIVHVPDATTTLALLEGIRQEFQVDQLVVTGTQKVFKEGDFKYLKERGFKYLYAVEGDTNNHTGSDKLSKIQAKKQNSKTKNPRRDFYYDTVVAEEGKKLYCHSPDKASEERFALEAKVTLLESELSALCAFAEDENISAFLKEGEHARYFELTLPADNGKMSYKLREEYYQSQLAGCGKYQLKTNSKTITDEEIIQIHNTSRKLKKDFSIIDSFDLPFGLEAKKSCFKGYLIVCYLALLIEGFIEMQLKKKDLTISAREAIESLANIKVTVNKLHNFEAISITERNLEQERILETLGMQNLHQEMSFGKMKGGSN
ncbi:MAG TPA: hypothetical protein VFD15_03385 [Clostridia bacterium]|nr:hypothetical protein [Clostridia bacterium]